ncbi:sulfate/thiosulfate ABC transporter ATP-binding protein CysA [Escherichia coli]|uniref:sulfate/thiosulfate ABC transporter ATP-binding protein CysA n=4 Tax=Gammaproteobacteria TaxID=1236 RepID=UPI00187D3DED|nr:sulfate/thiosulfate ABC transporter ATP-binding protein CysA [Escherichia coli]MBE7989125.1 sulfate/thiosulfate ABC transporter ATP-binding protein CysA [Escherichia coli]
MPAENIVEVHHLKKSVGQGEHELSILTGVELVVKRGETIALVGESGSGKSTLLAILAGLDDGSSGEVSLVGQPLHNMDEEARAKLRAKHVGFVFQSFMLIPTLNALENVELPALLRGESSAESRNGAKALLEQLGLGKRLDHLPAQLSGGEQQRVALARALAVEPQILLLDEPFGALDAQVRKELRRWLRQLHEELKFTSVFVTHDQEEATEVADRVVVMSQGNIEQADAPNQVWREPATRFVLEFMGEVNRLQGTIRGGQFHVGAHRWPLGYTPAYQGPVDLFLRPWEVDISRRTSLDSPLPVQVLEASPKGHYTQLVVQPLGWYNEPLTVVMHGDDAPQRGERLFVGLQHARLYNGDERIETRDEELALAQSA